MKRSPHLPKHCSRAAWYTAALVALPFLISTHVLGQGPRPDRQLRPIKHIIVIYQENWSFDSLYGLFPGANGLANSSAASLNQTDRFDNPLSGQIGQAFDLVSGSVALTTPPQPINTNLKPPGVDTRFNAGLNTLLPYDVLTNSTLQPNDKTGDIVHRFWH